MYGTEKKKKKKANISSWLFWKGLVLTTVLEPVWTSCNAGQF